MTASAKKLVIDDLSLLGFPVEEFFYIQTSEDTTVHKPDPHVFDPILHILEKGNNIPREETVYIGDAINDYYAAKKAGMQFYGFAQNKEIENEYKKNGVMFVTKFNQFEKIFSK